MSQAFKDMRAAGRKAVVEVSKVDYDEAFEVLPPIFDNGRWAMSEPMAHEDGKPVYAWFAKFKGHYYGVMATTADAGPAFAAHFRSLA